MTDYRYKIAIDDLEIKNLELRFTTTWDGSDSINIYDSYYDNGTGGIGCERKININFCGDIVEKDYNFTCSGLTSEGKPWEFNSRDIPLPPMKVTPFPFFGRAFKGTIVLVIGKFPEELKSLDKLFSNFGRNKTKIHLYGEERELLNNFFVDKLTNHKYHVESTEGCETEYHPLPTKGESCWEKNDMCFSGETESIKGLEGVYVHCRPDFYLRNRGLAKKINNQISYEIFHDEYGGEDEEYNEGFDESLKGERHKRRLRY